MISTRQLAYRYAGGPALAFADLDLPQGGVLLLGGASGSGKSTWLALVAGLIAPTAGQLEVAGQALAGVLLLTAVLSVFIALWGAVRERRADLALLRMLGAPPGKVAGLLVCEALWLALLATALGMLAGQGLSALLAWALQLEKSVLVASLAWPAELAAVPVLAAVLAVVLAVVVVVVVALASALLPARAAYRVNVAELLRSS